MLVDETKHGKKWVVASGGGGKGGGGGRTPVEDPDSLKSRAYAKVVDLLCEGEIYGLVDGLKSVYLNDTPLQDKAGTYNFKEVSIETRNGSVLQPALGTLPSVENTVSVGTEVRYNNPVVRTIIDPDVDICRVSIRVPNLSHQNIENGDLRGASVSLAVDYQPNGSSSWREGARVTIDGKTTSGYERDVGFRLKGDAPWNIRVSRLTEDSNSSYLQNKTVWGTITEVMEEKLRYPCSALVGININAEQFESIPKRAYDVKLMVVKVPSNYNPETREYSGVWDGTFKLSWTDNPAWCFYDIVTNNRYGVGDYVGKNSVDKWVLYNIAQYCDEMVDNGFGGKEPRFTCNLLLQTREEAFNVINDMASIFRGMAYWGSGTVVATQDSPRPVSWQFNNSSVIDGEFNYQSTALNTRYNVAYVTYNNPDENYKRSVVYVEDTDGILDLGYVNETNVTAFGCTSKSQAYRMGKWLLFTNKFENETVSFKVGVDGACITPNSVISIKDDLRDRTCGGGRVTSVSEKTLHLDRSFEFIAGKKYYVSVISKEGVLTKYDVVNTGLTSDNVTISTSGLAASVSVNSTYIISEKTRESLWRVVDVKEDDHTYSISAMKYFSDKYNYVENGISFDPNPKPDVSDLPPNPPSNVTTKSVNVSTPSGLLFKLDVSWNQSNSTVKSYTLSWKVKNGNSTKIEGITGLGYSIEGLAFGDEVEIKVWSVDVLGRLSANYASVVAVATGDIKKPDAVKSFFIKPEAMQLTLSWEALFNDFTKCVEIWSGVSQSDLQLLATLPTPSTSYVHSGLSLGVKYHYGIRLVDRWNNTSDFKYNSAETLKDPSGILDQIGGSITGDQLVDSLREPIEKLPTIVENLEGIDGALGDLSDALLEQILADDVVFNKSVATQNTFAGVKESVKVVADETGALAQKVTQVEAKTDGNTAKITQVETAYTNADTALSKKIDEVYAEALANGTKTYKQPTAPTPPIPTGSIWYDTSKDNAPSRWNGTAWESIRDEDISKITAMVKTESEARIEADKVLASNIQTVQTTVNGNTASIEESKKSIDGLKAEYTLKVNAGGKVAGIGLAASAEGSAVDILADKFRVSLPNGTESKPVFTVGTVNGKEAVGIAGDLIVDGAITSNKISVGSLDAVSANIGLLRTASTGARLEIESNQLRVYDTNGRLRVRLGVW